MIQTVEWQHILCFLFVSPIQPVPKRLWRSPASWRSVWEKHEASWRRSCQKEWTTAWPSWTMTHRDIWVNRSRCWRLCCKSVITLSQPAFTPSTRLRLCSGPVSATCSTAWTRYSTSWEILLVSLSTNENCYILFIHPNVDIDLYNLFGFQHSLKYITFS